MSAWDLGPTLDVDARWLVTPIHGPTYDQCLYGGLETRSVMAIGMRLESIAVTDGVGLSIRRERFVCLMGS